MNESEIHKLIDKKFRERKIPTVARNTIGALCQLFPPASVIWQILAGSKEKLDTEKGAITLEVLLDIVLAIDKKLNDSILGTREQEAFEIMLEGIRAIGDVTGMRARTSDSNLRKIFTEKEVKVILKDITSRGKVTGVDLTVDRELELKKRLEVETDFGSVKLNPDVGEITFGKGLKSSDDDHNNSS